MNCISKILIIVSLLLLTPNIVFGACATWSTTLKDSDIILSDNNLKAVAINLGSVKTTVAEGSGKFYYEITIMGGTNLIMIGHGNTNATTSTFAGFDSYGTSLYSGNGYIYNNNIPYSFTRILINGDILGYAMDLDNDIAYVYLNNKYQGQYNLGAGSIYPMFGTNVTAGAVMANFGATQFAYTPPLGFHYGLESLGTGCTEAYTTGYLSDALNATTSVIVTNFASSTTSTTTDSNSTDNNNQLKYLVIIGTIILVGGLFEMIRRNISKYLT